MYSKKKVQIHLNIRNCSTEHIAYNIAKLTTYYRGDCLLVDTYCTLQPKSHSVANSKYLFKNTKKIRFDSACGRFEVDSKDGLRI